MTNEENKFDHACDCGCEHEHNHEIEHEPTVTLVFDDDEEVTCAVLGTFDVEEKQYIALVPEGDDEVIIYRYSEEDGEPSLDQIESDEEYEKVADVFYELFGDEEDDSDDEDSDEE